MEQQTGIALCATAASIGFFHTLMGPDHYLPFVAISKAKNWTISKTMLITFICGIGHVLSSVLLGFGGIGLGIAVGKLVGIEEFRGEWAGWLLLGFGIVYMVWGIKQAINPTHSHKHLHVAADGQIKAHEHLHNHDNSHAHLHENKDKKLTVWILFLIFVFGPCEPLIPILMYPAFEHNTWWLFAVTLVFTVTTISTMMVMVYFLSKGFKAILAEKLERYTHVLAGGIITCCGLAIKMGL